MIIDGSLPLGLISNTAAVMGVTIGKRHPGAVGRDVRDGADREHLGIVALPIPILRGDAASIRAVRETLYAEEYADLTVVDFSDTAQSCKTYDEFVGKMAGVSEEDLRYFGVAVYGDRKKVNKLTGSLPLLR